MVHPTELLIRRREGWERVHYREVWAHRELLYFLVWRDIKIRYKQTLLGGLWAILQPLLGALVLGGLLRRVGLSGVPGIPFILFVYSGLVLWTFFANAVSMAGNSLIGSEQLIRKVYFPRVLIPLAAIGALILDLAISVAFLGLLLLFYRWPLTPMVALAPVIVLATFLTSAGLGMALAALNVQFSDVKYAVPFLIQMGLFVTPVIYPLAHAPGSLRLVLSLNPVAGLMEGWRAAVLGTPIAWGPVIGSLAASVVLFFAGLMFLQRRERAFADMI
jgi:lipopolysaccharide transport system permease protein